MSSEQNNTAIIVHVKPDNGDVETRYLLLVIAVILLLGWVAVQFNQRAGLQGSPHTQLSVTAKKALTQLKNGADEIAFLLAPGDPLPAIAELQEMQLPPFYLPVGELADYRWSKAQGRCYLGQPRNQNDPWFMARFDEQVSIYWHHADGHLALPTTCDLNSEWLRFNAL